MHKKTINLLQCKCGDILADDIINRYGTSVVTKDTILNDYIKQKLFEMGISHVNIYFSDTSGSQNISREYQEFSEKYRSNLIIIKQIVNDLAVGKGVDHKKIDNVSDILYNQVIEGNNAIPYLNQLKLYDEGTYIHGLNVSIYAALLGKWLEMTENEIKNLIRAGILHDVGKVTIPKNILNKREWLLPEEFETIKQHTVLGYEMLKNDINIPDEVKKVALMHHERVDGSGYPYGTGYENVNLYTKVIAIVDVYDAVTSERTYKARNTPFEAFEWFYSSGLSGFDISILNTFIKCISNQYIGTKVLLSNGITGEIVYIPLHMISKPIVKAGTVFIDLAKQTDFSIVRLM